MERRLESGTATKVRCLDCGTVYDQPERPADAEPCPTCGYVGWIALAAGAGDDTDVDS